VSKPKSAVETASPVRNFTLDVESRVRAIAGGLPAYVRRKRRIEDLEEAIVVRLADLLRKTGDEAQTLERAPRHLLVQLVDLVERHNRWYPSEANLPLHPRTGAMLERGEPWKPLALPTMESLLARARARVDCDDA
jgi:hypothetical protein